MGFCEGLVRDRKLRLADSALDHLDDLALQTRSWEKVRQAVVGALLDPSCARDGVLRVAPTQLGGDERASALRKVCRFPGVDPFPETAAGDPATQAWVDAARIAYRLGHRKAAVQILWRAAVGTESLDPQGTFDRLARDRCDAPSVESWAELVDDVRLLPTDTARFATAQRLDSVIRELLRLIVERK